MCKEQKMLEDKKARHTKDIHHFLQAASLSDYLLQQLRAASPIQRFKHFWSIFKAFRTVAFAFRITTTVFLFLETGTLFLLSAAVLLVLLPIVALILMGSILIAALRSRKANRQMEKILSEKKVYVQIPTTEELTEHTVAEHADESSCVSLVVSPYWVSRKGICASGKFYFTVRKEMPSVYLVRRYYFFSLKKHVLTKCKNVTYRIGMHSPQITKQTPNG